MRFMKQSQNESTDLLLVQAERVFLQRQSRKAVIDAELLGEPGWDIMLCAYIARRKGDKCTITTLSDKIDLNGCIIKRWVLLLMSRDMIVENEGSFVISDIAEMKISMLFSKQMQELMQYMNKL